MPMTQAQMDAAMAKLAARTKASEEKKRANGAVLMTMQQTTEASNQSNKFRRMRKPKYVKPTLTDEEKELYKLTMHALKIGIRNKGVVVSEYDTKLELVRKAVRCKAFEPTDDDMLDELLEQANKVEDMTDAEREAYFETL